jgi:hypothetical protein
MEDGADSFLFILYLPLSLPGAEARARGGERGKRKNNEKDF